MTDSTATLPRAIDRKHLIEGLGKGLRLLEAFSDSAPRLTATEAGERVGLTRTAARRYLLSLVHFGYAATDGKHYWLLPRVLRLGQSYLDAARLPRLVQPFIQRASTASGETVNVGVLDRHEIVYIARSNTPRVVTIGFHPGARVPAHVVSQSYVILATFDDAALDAWIAAHDFAMFSSYTITDRARFRDAVLAARAQGYWEADQYVDLGLSGIAVALMDRKGACLGAISSTVQRPAYPGHEMATRLLPGLQEAAQSLRAVL